MQLTKKDIKTIKYERRPGIVFPAIILTFGGIINLIYIESGRFNINWTLIFIIDIGIIAFSVLLSYFMTQKYNKDLKSGIRKIKIEKVDRKEKQTIYEAGSGTLNTPILGDLFPKLWGQEMKPKHKLNLIINNSRYKVDKLIYDKIQSGDLVEMHYSEFSEILLNIELKENDKARL